MGPKTTPKSMIFCLMFAHILSFFMPTFVSRPSGILFSLVLQSNNKQKQGKATQEKTQDQTCPRQDQTDRSSCHHAKHKSTRKNFRLHGGAQIVPKKIARVSPCLRMFFGVVYGCFCWQNTGGCCKNNFKQLFKDKL